MVLAAALLSVGLAAAAGPAALAAVAGPAAPTTPAVPATPGTSEGSAGATPAPAARCGTPQQCFARLAARQQEIRTLGARFRQTKRVALLREPLVSSGRLEYRRPDYVRWEVAEPEPLVVEIAGGRLRAGPPGRLEPIEAVEADAAARLFRDLGAIFTAAGELVPARFALAPGDADTSFILTPRDRAAARLVEAIELELDPASGAPRRTVLREANGDRTEIELSDLELNRAVHDGPAAAEASR